MLAPALKRETNWEVFRACALLSRLLADLADRTLQSVVEVKVLVVLRLLLTAQPLFRGVLVIKPQLLCQLVELCSSQHAQAAASQVLCILLTRTRSSSVYSMQCMQQLNKHAGQWAQQLATAVCSVYPADDVPNHLLFLLSIVCMYGNQGLSAQVAAVESVATRMLACQRVPQAHVRKSAAACLFSLVWADHDCALEAARQPGTVQLLLRLMTDPEKRVSDLCSQALCCICSRHPQECAQNACDRVTTHTSSRGAWHAHLS